MRGRGCGEHGNRISKRGPDRYQPAATLKIPASTVPFGESISLTGKTVWAAYDDAGVLVAVGSTAGEVRVKYREAVRRRERKEYSERKAKAMDVTNNGTPIE
jgi:hypothetical protein